MKNVFLHWTTLLTILFLTTTADAIEVQLYHTDISNLEALSVSSLTTSTDGSFAIAKGATTPSGGTVSWASNTSFFLTSGSAGQITFNNLNLNNGGRIVIKWGSASSRALYVSSGSTFNSSTPDIGTHAALASAEKSTVITDNFTIPSTLTGSTSITINSSGGGSVYVFDVTVYTNSKGPIIDAFTLAGASGTIDTSTGAIAVTVPFATNLSSLVPTFALATGTTFVTPSEQTAAKDFTSAVSYLLTDGSDTKTYTVTVTKTHASTARDILTFTIPGQVGTSVFQAASGSAIDSIIVTVPYSTTNAAIQTLIPTYTISPLSTSSPASGLSQDFTSPVLYTVTAQDGTQKSYGVRVKRAVASAECSITNFSLVTTDEDVSIDEYNKTITITVGNSTSITSVVPNDITISALSSISPTATTSRDFSSPVTYVVTAEDGITTKTYTVTTTKDVTAPTITATTPTNNSVDVSLAGVITLTFSEKVKLGTGAITLGTTTLIPNTISSLGSTTVTIPFSGLISLTTYTVTIPAKAFSDMFGNETTTPTTITFTTADGVNKIYPYASHMDGVNFEVPAFITGTYDATADVKASTTTQYGAYKLAPGEKLTINTSRVGTVKAIFYALGGSRNFSISNNTATNVTVSDSFSNYENKGKTIEQVIDSNVSTEVYLTNEISSTGDVYVSYIYISDVSQPALTEKAVWCK